jgi:hypothetical protein
MSHVINSRATRSLYGPVAGATQHGKERDEKEIEILHLCFQLRLKLSVTARACKRSTNSVMTVANENGWYLYAHGIHAAMPTLDDKARKPILAKLSKLLGYDPTLIANNETEGEYRSRVLVETAALKLSDAQEQGNATKTLAQKLAQQKERAKEERALIENKKAIHLNFIAPVKKAK